MRDLVLLVVEDDPLILQTVKIAVPEPWRVLPHTEAQNLPVRGYHAALVDVHLTGRMDKFEGLDVVGKLRALHSQMEIISYSGDLNRELMEKCLTAGATRFLAKPLSEEELRLTLQKIEALFEIQGAVSRGRHNSAKWIGQGTASQRVQREIAHLRNEPGPILLEGESGTGKEVTAQLIHSTAPETPFVIINVAGVPENLFESEFFGYIKGAFTGADQNRMGLAEAAHGGDLFLDEIEALSLPLQAKLLRFLESGEVRRVGAKDTVIVQTRVIAATNRNLHDMVSKNLFREDLLWRLSGKKIVLPPLRERKEDLLELANYFLALDKVRSREFGSDAVEAMKDYDWPGNVRELKRVCEQLLLVAPLPIIRKQDVQRLLRPAVAGENAARERLDLSRGLVELVEGFEKHVLEVALATTSEVDDIARLLKISRSSLYKKIKDHSLTLRGGS